MCFHFPFGFGRHDSTNHKQSKGNAPMPSDKKRLLLVVAINTLLLTAIYFSCNYYGFWIIFPIYAVLLAVLTLVYLIYNRGFSRKGIREEDLPFDWTLEEKRTFLADGERRMKKSRWMLTLILPLLLAFLFDFICLGLSDLLGWGN